MSDRLEARPCESCGTPGRLLVFVPNGQGAGRRLCLDCLRVVDALRARPPRTL